jgi:hypothetical protein
MSLRDELATLKTEQANLVERLQKLDEKKDKVRPELYNKLRAELDGKTAALDKNLAEVEAAIAEEDRLAEERRREEERLAEERRLEAERLAEEQRREEARRAAESRKRQSAEEIERRHAEREAAVRQEVLDRHADELSALRAEWRRQFDAKAHEIAEYIETRKRECEDLGLKMESQRLQVEELNLRKEIGEFDDDACGYDQLFLPLQADVDKCQADIVALTQEIEVAEGQHRVLEATAEPDFAAQILEKYAAELAAPEEEEIYEPEEEIYEPPAAGGRVVTEEEIESDSVAEDEDIVTEYEELYEDDTEEAFFTTTGRTSMNPCLIERKANGRTHVHELVASGDKTYVGSREECAVFLPYPGIDPKHAWIRTDRHGQYMIKDLGSRGGVFVNGKRTKKALLKNGDVVKFANTELTLKLV